MVPTKVPHATDSSCCCSKCNFLGTSEGWKSGEQFGNVVIFKYYFLFLKIHRTQYESTSSPVPSQGSRMLPISGPLQNLFLLLHGPPLKFLASSRKLAISLNSSTSEVESC
ncbi:hypothetical protein CEXT_629491 [Caerostris extrusa]|uniref:Ycf15 n=1 Tax=Caerostris extrusa TaxID=172846 RepID=A0AAV4QPW7_CAEEX|nr:hypothetical protein CEXT_629491 [Caerostris extrusa]